MFSKIVFTQKYFFPFVSSKSEISAEKTKMKNFYSACFEQFSGRKMKVIIDKESMNLYCCIFSTIVIILLKKNNWWFVLGLKRSERKKDDSKACKTRLRSCEFSSTLSQNGTMFFSVSDSFCFPKRYSYKSKITF